MPLFNASLYQRDWKPLPGAGDSHDELPHLQVRPRRCQQEPGGTSFQGKMNLIKQIERYSWLVKLKIEMQRAIQDKHGNTAASHMHVFINIGRCSSAVLAIMQHTYLSLSLFE